ncbi:MAG: hypothetical protein ACKVT2_01325 [Saprospiraceae bacterium]
MKNTLFLALVIFITGNLCHFGLPWWCLAPIAFLAAWLLAQSAWSAFLGGFLSGFLLWYINAWFPDNSNGGLLSAKVGQLFMGIPGWQLLLATGILGGLLGALSALTGHWGRAIFGKPSSKRKRSYLQERRR